MVSIGQTMFSYSDRFSLPVIVITSRAHTLSKQLARPGEVKTYQLRAGGRTCRWDMIVAVVLIVIIVANERQSSCLCSPKALVVDIRGGFHGDGGGLLF